MQYPRMPLLIATIIMTSASASSGNGSYSSAESHSYVGGGGNSEVFIQTDENGVIQTEYRTGPDTAQSIIDVHVATSSAAGSSSASVYLKTKGAGGTAEVRTRVRAYAATDTAESALKPATTAVFTPVSVPQLSMFGRVASFLAGLLGLWPFR